ncbi:hypothetical protein [Mycobacterium sp. 29Ha]|uniref:hypothetical protein n=1 Tax=Mycobacterium sp. 29Ha TaxID=2939268 RepID=UPI0029391529|nr:hypothetical protein [Mycobacterium sp. 29Ha]MDV3133243.1 hypothetical protein [Mycobacterium sp. 29Ha]
MTRYIGMDVHREFAQLAVVEDGLVRDEDRIGVTPEVLRTWASELRPDDEVALEATGNSDAIATLLTPLVGPDGGVEILQRQLGGLGGRRTL